MTKKKYICLVSERELNIQTCSLYVIDGPSVCLSSVCRLSVTHMSFRLVQKSVTLDDLERRNSHIRIVISPNSVAFEADYVKVVEDTPVLTAAEM